ncbi:MAG: helix-turn-helix transcriptional regulator [Methanobacteriaceae archaeon]|nr:helix-turn-helix transcriptional regulator [Methanobacteriaceae archaeon]
MNGKRIGENIALLRKRKGLTQKALGDKLYVTDKAISKWERGINLPDLSIIEKLSEELDTNIYDLLQIENQDDFNKSDLKNMIKVLNKKNSKKNKIIVCGSIVIIVLIIGLFKNISFGYDLKKYESEEKSIELGIPKFSFMNKNNDESYSFKNLRSSHVVKGEFKEYLKTLEYLSCNDTIYYYDKDNNISIIDYKVKDNFLFTSANILITNNDYCYMETLNEYSKYIKVNEGYSMNYTRNVVNGKLEDIDGKITIVLSLLDDEANKFRIDLKVIKQHNTYGETLEHSLGTYEIKNGKFIYYRDKILEFDSIVQIPTVSTFTIENKKLILDENYLFKYTDKVVLM